MTVWPTPQESPDMTFLQDKKINVGVVCHGSLLDEKGKRKEKAQWFWS